jgi:hypothetical protein
MPAMQDLLTQLQESPPQTEQELEQLLDSTGYDLVMKEPMSEEYEEDMGPEDAGLEEEGEEEEEDGEMEMEDSADLMQSLMPPGMGAPHPNENPRMKVRRMTMVAAHKALPKDKE